MKKTYDTIFDLRALIGGAGCDVILGATKLGVGQRIKPSEQWSVPGGTTDGIKCSNWGVLARRDTRTIDSAADVVDAGEGDDMVAGSLGADSVQGGNGDDNVLRRVRAVLGSAIDLRAACANYSSATGQFDHKNQRFSRKRYGRRRNQYADRYAICRMTKTVSHRCVSSLESQLLRTSRQEGIAMSRFKKSLQILLIVIATTQITACSKTVQWEEEVLLNTGETIWVNRTDTFERRSEPGNPLQSGWWPISRAVKFTWQGQAYSFQTGTTAIMMIHKFNATGAIAVIAWVKACEKRGYAEFRWSNGNWQLQPNVNPALIGQPRNLTDYYSATDGDIPARVTQEFIRNSRFDLPQKGGTESHLLASRIAINCSGNK